MRVESREVVPLFFIQDIPERVRKQRENDGKVSIEPLKVLFGCVLFEELCMRVFAVSDGNSIFVSEKPAKGNKLAVLLLKCYPLS